MGKPVEVDSDWRITTTIEDGLKKGIQKYLWTANMYEKLMRVDDAKEFVRIVACGEARCRCIVYAYPNGDKFRVYGR